MKRFAAGVSVFLASVLLSPLVVFAYTSPGNPSGYVNDFAHVMSEAAKNTLETKLAAFEKDTSNQISVVTVLNMGSDYVEHFAAKLFEEWGVGRKDVDNGVLLLLSIEEHKLRIEVGYGLEGALPDSIAKSILDNEMTPRLKQGDYDGAVTAGVESILAATKNEYVATEVSKDLSTTDIIDLFQLVFITLILVPFMTLQMLAAVLGRSKSWWAGGIVGFVGGSGIGWFLSLGFFILLPMVLVLTLLGLAFDYAVSNAYRSAKASGLAPPWWAGGSTGGSGSGGGGGFGGFGGGGSGGGGASGGW